MYRITLTLVLLWFPAVQMTQYTKEVKTSLGYVRGKIVNLPTGKTVDAYLGIPYGAPPVGKLRYKRPIPASTWDGVKNVVQFSNSCMQNPNRVMKLLPGGKRMLPSTPVSEDCLYLNVWVPRSNPRKATVMVFIHGGGFSIGSTSTPGYSGGTLSSEEDIVVVSFNYRLASFGFMFLDHEDIDVNVALFDQVLALNWVKDNIANFGGDPGKVTLFGQSAGAASIGFHMVSSLSRDLFQRAILESGSPISDWSVKTKDYMKKLSLTVAEYSGCLKDRNMSRVIQCLRDTDALELINNEPIKWFDVFTFWPVVDGKMITEYPINQYQRGDFKKTELLVGATKNEGTGFMVLAVPHTYLPTTNRIKGRHEDLVEAIHYHFPNESEITRKVIEFEYTNWKNVDDSEGILSSSERMIGDYFFTCDVNKMGQIFAKSGLDVYEYYFTHRSQGVEWRSWFGTPHTEELRYIFGDVFDEDSKFTEDDKNFSKRIMGYWTNFARTGNPNLSPSGRNITYDHMVWPKFSVEDQEYLILAPKCNSVGTKLKAKKCAFWDQLLPFLKGSSPRANSVL